MPYQPVGRLRKRAKEAAEDRRGLRGVSCFKETVKLDAVILRRQRRLVQAGVDIGERLQRFLMGRYLVEDGLILGDGLAKLVLLEVAAGPLEMFVDVRSHWSSSVLRAPLTWQAKRPAHMASPIWARALVFGARAEKQTI